MSERGKQVAIRRARKHSQLPPPWECQKCRDGKHDQCIDVARASVGFTNRACDCSHSVVASVAQEAVRGTARARG